MVTATTSVPSEASALSACGPCSTLTLGPRRCEMCHTKKPRLPAVLSADAAARLAAIDSRRLAMYANPNLTSAFGASEQCLTWFSAYLTAMGIKFWGDATPRDVVNFLIDHDIRSVKKREVVHLPPCEWYRTQHTDGVVRACECPIRLSADTVDTMAANLKTALERKGLVARFSVVEAAGNPVDAREVEEYLSLLKLEQADCNVSGKQKPRLSEEQYHAVVRYGLKQWQEHKKNAQPLRAVAALRDVFIFSLLWAFLDRGVEVVGMSMSQVIVDSAANTLTVLKGKTKTRRTVRELQSAVIIAGIGGPTCPILLHNAYMQEMRTLGTPLEGSTGPLFRAMRLNRVKGQPPGVSSLRVTTAVVRHNFGNILAALSLPRWGLHALRRGKVAALSTRGPCADTDCIKTVAGWTSAGPTMPNLYSGVDEVPRTPLVPTLAEASSGHGKKRKRGPL